MSKFYFSIVAYVFFLSGTALIFYFQKSTAILYGLVAISILYLLFLLAMSMLIQLNFYLNAINQNKRNNIVLTFDDGPHPKYTLQILNILDAYNIKAVFFMIGKQVRAYPEVAREVVKRGHQIGSHTQNHSYNFGFMKGNRLRQELADCKTEIKKATGVQSFLFRPPFGVTNPLIAQEILRLNFVTIGWNVRSFDTTTKSIDTIVQRVTKKINSRSIVLLHDRLEQTCKALPLIIEGIRQKGYTIKSLVTNDKE